MPTDQWNPEHMRVLRDGVLRRGARRLRQALHHLDGEQSDSVERMRQSLRAMEQELARRDDADGTKTKEKRVRSSRDDDVRPRQAAQREARLSGTRPARAVAQRKPEGDRERSAAAPAKEPPGGRASRAKTEAEPVWRLIPHLSGTSSKIVSVLDEDGVVRHQSEPIKWLLGFEADALVGEPLAVFLRGDSQGRAEEAVARMARAEEKFDSWNLEFRTASGGSFWLEGMASNFLRDPRLGGILVYWRELVG